MKIKKLISDIRKRKPGTRFRYVYRRFRQMGWQRIFISLLGVLLVLMGVVLLFIPGPGLLLILLGFICCATLSYRLAKKLDETEKQFSKR